MNHAEELPLGTRSSYDQLTKCREKLTTEDFSQHSEGDYITGNDPTSFAGGQLRVLAGFASHSRFCSRIWSGGDMEGS